MIIQPRVRGFVCITAHPAGCARHIDEQIAFVKSQPPIESGPKNVLILGASTGYGLASRIVSAFGCKSNTVGVFFERPSLKGKPASAGWYNAIAVEKAAHREGLYARSINGDAFSNAIKEETIDLIKRDLGKLDLVIYSLAAPRRIHPRTGETFKSVLKPIGQDFKNKTLNTDRKTVEEIELPPATQEEIDATIAVMGGEDWEMWMEALINADLLARGIKTVAYSYIGPEVTWPIYKNGTIGAAKDDLSSSAGKIDAQLKEELGGQALVSVNKAVVTQASSAIPVVPLYLAVLLKIMREKGIDEGCVEQIHRLFSTRLYGSAPPVPGRNGLIRIDDLEMRPDVQQAIVALWPEICSENLLEISDFARYQKEFLKLFGFGFEGVDYEADISPEVDFPN